MGYTHRCGNRQRPGPGPEGAIFIGREKAMTEKSWSGVIGFAFGLGLGAALARIATDDLTLCAALVVAALSWTATEYVTQRIRSSR